MESRKSSLNDSRPLDLSTTVRIMRYRAIQRKVNGHHKKSTTTKILWVNVVTLTFLTLLASSLWSIDLTRFWQEVTILTLMIALLVYVIVQISLLFSWCLYWIVVTTGVLFLIKRDALQTNNSDTTQYLSMVVFSVFIVVELATILYYFWRRNIYPNLVQRNVLDPTKSWDIVPLVRWGHFAWKSKRWWSKLSFTKQNLFSYVGQVNHKGEPDGFGVWTTDRFSGEILSGFWKEGIPIGPFKSREYGTGFSFANVRVGFMSTSAGPWDKNTFAMENAAEYRFGVVGVECSVSGKFFMELPNSTLINPPATEAEILEKYDEPNPMSWVIRDLLHISELKQEHSLGPSILTVQCQDDGTLSIPGYVSSSKDDSDELLIRVVRQRVTPKSSPYPTPTCSISSIKSNDKEEDDSTLNVPPFLSIEGWHPVQNSPPNEAIIFIHGYNCALKDAVERFGQLLTLGDLPGRIKPIVFNWPGGNLFRYSKAFELIASEKVHVDFNNLIQYLARAGIRNIHLLAHSMGARLVMNCLKSGKCIFREKGTDLKVSHQQTQNESIPQLASVTLLNPEASLEDFKAIHYPILKKYTNLITIYGNNRDVALRSAEIVYSTKLLGCRIHDLHATTKQDQTHNSSLGPPSPSSQPFSCSDSGTSSCLSKSEFLGLPLSNRKEKTWLDVDVIDTTWLEVNVHAARHSYFNINKLVVDDIMDLIIHRRRALHRGHRLLCIDGNIYSFLSAPPYVVN